MINKDDNVFKCTFSGDKEPDFNLDWVSATCVTSALDPLILYFPYVLLIMGISICLVQKGSTRYVLARLQKKIRFDFDDEINIRDVRCKHLTKIIIKVQLF